MSAKPSYEDLEKRIRDLEIKLGEKNRPSRSLFADSAERDRAREELDEEKIFLGKLIDTIPIPVFYKDRDGRYTGFNKAFEIFFGEPREKLIGKTVFDINPPELAEIYHDKDNELFESGGLQSYESRFENSQGLMRDVIIHKSVFTDEKGTIVGLIGAIQDITSRKKMEKALHSSQERLKALSDASFEAIFLSDKGVCLDQNQTAEKMFGYSHNEAVGRHGTEWIVPEDREMVSDNMKKGVEDPYEVRALRKDGSTFPCEIQGRMIHYNGRPIRVTALRNISLRKRAEEKLTDLNKVLVERTKLAEERAVYIQKLAMELSKAEDRERERIACLLHGDLQQMLAYARLKFNSLFKGEKNDRDLDVMNDLIDGCIKRCRNLSHDLKPFVYQQKDFLGALEWVCRQMKEHYGLDVAIEAAADPEIGSTVLTSLLIRSIRELLFNVVKHSGEKSASIILRFDGRYMLVSVRDDGVGCDPDALRAKKEGNETFGLFDIEDRVNFLGGRMQVETDAGSGFRVSLYVPKDIPGPPERDRPASDFDGMPVFMGDGKAIEPADAIVESTITVLLADDHSIMRDGLAELINRQSGIEVVGTAANGQEAVELTAKLKPAVVLMDVSMPVMNGIDATRMIHESFPDTKIIGLTMHQDPCIHEAMLDAGAFVCLSKSGSPWELIETIQLAHSDKTEPS